MSDVLTLEISLYGQSIATLTNVGGDRTIFAFNEAYIDDENRPTLGLRFQDALGDLITDFKPTQKQLMPFLSNLLPEGHMRKYLAESVNVNPGREFFLLWALGDDLAGAITVKPVEGEIWPDKAYEKLDAGEKNLTGEKPMRFSLAGVQLKFSAINEVRGGLTIPASGAGGNWIIKLPSREFAGVPENEYSMMSLAQSVGINVPEIKLVDLKDIEGLPSGIGKIDGNAFAIERFDRFENGGVIHTEDFAQVFDVYPVDKYKKAKARKIAYVLAQVSDEISHIEFIRRLTFNTLIGNGDMHLKNWSLIYPDRHNAALAPAYDFVSTIPYIVNEKAALKFSRSDHFEDFDADELSHLAAKALLPEKMVLDTARETVGLFHQHWADEKKNLPLYPEVIEAIDRHLDKLPKI